MTKYIIVVLCLLFISTAVHAATLIDINTAGKTSLMTLSGIGEVKAQAIIDYRTTNGPFVTIEGIMNVSGIGTATFNSIKAFITVSSSQANTSVTQTQSDSQSGNASSSTSSVQPSAPLSSYVAPPNPTIFVDAGGDRTVIVGADTEYVGRAYNKKQENIELVRYMWNFGDGTTAEGPSVLHHFDYPGRYAVLLSIAHDRETQASRIIVTAEPANLGFNTLGDGGVSIENRAGRDLDLSKWIIQSFGRLFVLPEHSVILSGSSMRVSSKTLNFFSGTETELAYPNGSLALRVNNSESEQALPTSSPNAVHVDTTAVSKAPPAYAQSRHSPIKESVSGDMDTAPETEMLPLEISSSSAMLAAAGNANQGSSSWWLIAGGLSASLGAAAYAIRRMKRKEWDIVEET